MFVRADVRVCNLCLYAQLHNTSFDNTEAPTLLFNYMLTPKCFSKLAFWVQQMLINQMQATWHTYILQNSLGQCTHAYVCARICLCMQHMLICTASQYKLWQYGRTNFAVQLHAYTKIAIQISFLSTTNAYKPNERYVIHIHTTKFIRTIQTCLCLCAQMSVYATYA